MNGQDFLRIVTEAFAPFLRELGFQMETPAISGRYYLARFSDSARIISVCYEPGDDYLSVTVFRRDVRVLSDIDDPAKNPNLSHLNRCYMRFVTNEERAKNEAFFKSIVINDEQEGRVLTAAKELRLVLPKYLSS